MTDDPIDEGVATGDGREDLRARATENGIEFFLAMFVDLHGKPCAKAVPMASFDLLMDGGAGFAGFAAGDLGQCPADPDITAVPDPASYTRVPWKDGGAVLHCDPYVDGEPWPYAPRMILKRLLAELADDRGWTLKTGVEAEYSLLRRTPDGKLEIADARLGRRRSPCEVEPHPRRRTEPGLRHSVGHEPDGSAEGHRVRGSGDHHTPDAQTTRQDQHVLDQPAAHVPPHPPRIDEQVLQFQHAVRPPGRRESDHGAGPADRDSGPLLRESAAGGLQYLRMGQQHGAVTGIGQRSRAEDLPHSAQVTEYGRRIVTDTTTAT